MTAIGDMKCPQCDCSLWPQKGSEEEEKQDISYRVCTSKRCDYRIKTQWNAERKTVTILGEFPFREAVG